VPEPPSVALIDFRSLLRGATSDATCREAVELVAELSRSSISPSSRTASPPRELRCRLYGGFRDRSGRPTPEYVGLLRHIDLLRGLARGVRTVPAIALNIMSLPSDDLVGTYRRTGQKMVDTTMAADCAALAGGGWRSLTLVSNDDDFVPVLLSITGRGIPVQWLRRSRDGDNDALLSRQGVRLLSDPAWP
jgi:uncharacterized LabA/DUF88 family protein